MTVASAIVFSLQNCHCLSGVLKLRHPSFREVAYLLSAGNNRFKSIICERMNKTQCCMVSTKHFNYTDVGVQQQTLQVVGNQKPTSNSKLVSSRELAGNNLREKNKHFLVW